MRQPWRGRMEPDAWFWSDQWHNNTHQRHHLGWKSNLWHPKVRCILDIIYAIKTKFWLYFCGYLFIFSFSTSMFYKRAAQRIELFWKNVSPDDDQNKVGGSILLLILSFKVTVELSLRADKELKDGDQIPIQFVVRFAGMHLFGIFIWFWGWIFRTERGQCTRLYKGYNPYCKGLDRFKWPFPALPIYRWDEE